MVAKIRTMNPLAALMILIMIVIGFSAISLGLTNLTSFDIRKSVTNTEDIIESGNRTNILIREMSNQTESMNNLTRLILAFQTETEENRQALANVLVPALQRSFNQTESIEELVQNLSELEERSEKRSQRLLPPFERFLNGTDKLLSNQEEMLRLLNQ